MPPNSLCFSVEPTSLETHSTNHTQSFPFDLDRPDGHLTDLRSSPHPPRSNPDQGSSSRTAGPITCKPAPDGHTLLAPATWRPPGLHRSPQAGRLAPLLRLTHSLSLSLRVQELLPWRRRGAPLPPLQVVIGSAGSWPPQLSRLAPSHHPALTCAAAAAYVREELAPPSRPLAPSWAAATRGPPPSQLASSPMPQPRPISHALWASTRPQPGQATAFPGLHLLPIDVDPRPNKVSICLAILCCMRN
ncbi:hypothetical protein ZWY2020_010549 [Hordeum vulgare]|nr:hypothetical protein ZWY2020_010549 [Hordeum vulgare]